VLLRRLSERGLVQLDGAGPRKQPVVADDGILLRGSKGPAVKALKKRLRAWYERHAPGEWETFRIADDGNFGGGLDKAVRRFQAWAALTVDGEVGEDTLAALAAKPAKVNTAAYKDLAFTGVLQQGARGERVRLAQSWMSLHGFQVRIDGGFGTATSTALRAFQAKRGLPTSGKVDEATQAALVAPMLAALAPIRKKKMLGELVLAYANQHLRQRPREIGGQNRGPWVRLYTDGREGDQYPWCAGFVTFCVKQACETLGVALPLERTLGCDVMTTSCGRRFLEGAGPASAARITPGSIFVQRAVGDERKLYKYRHTGIVVSASAETMQTIEGNTNDDGSAEGYEVCARTRGYKDMDFILP
jgi:peptidoglycan hydrolase-like protein with peptidoglycan-binding domain